MTSITTRISLPFHPRKRSSFVYIRFLRVTVNDTQSRSEIQWRRISKVNSSIKRCIGHRHVCVYDHIVALKSWHLHSFPMLGCGTRYPVCDEADCRATWFKALMQTKLDIPVLEVEQNKCLWTLFHWCFGDCRMLAYKISACEVCIVWLKPIAACKIWCH